MFCGVVHTECVSTRCVRYKHQHDDEDDETACLHPPACLHGPTTGNTECLFYMHIRHLTCKQLPAPDPARDSCRVWHSSSVSWRASPDRQPHPCSWSWNDCKNDHVHHISEWVSSTPTTRLGWAKDKYYLTSWLTNKVEVFHFSVQIIYFNNERNQKKKESMGYTHTKKWKPILEGVVKARKQGKPIRVRKRIRRMLEKKRIRHLETNGEIGQLVNVDQESAE